ncbi:MAG: Hsp20/alpha crystallin family protein [Bacillota bacterium]|jgi:HSP20 family protein
MFNLVPYNRRFPRFLFRDFFNDDFFGLTTVKADVYQDGDNLVIEAELPGFSKDEVKVQVSENQLTISAQRDETKEEKSENYFRRERSVNQACRTFIIEDLDPDKIHADFKDGLLKLTIEKPKKLKPQAKEIEIH